MLALPQGTWAKFSSWNRAEPSEPDPRGPIRWTPYVGCWPEKAADLIRSDPVEAARALEMGIVDRRWLDRPGERPISTSTPVDIVERFLEMAVEQRPSRLASLGLNAVQLLATHGTTDANTPKMLTVVFTDLEGFTAFTDTHGDAAAVGLIEEHRRLARPVVRQWSGKILKTLGDGLLCTFPDAEAGVHAALELLETAPAPLRLRAGVHVGEAMVSAGDVMGHVVNVAARVTETAGGGGGGERRGGRPGRRRSDTAFWQSEGPAPQGHLGEGRHLHGDRSGGARHWPRGTCLSEDVPQSRLEGAVSEGVAGLFEHSG